MTSKRQNIDKIKFILKGDNYLNALFTWLWENFKVILIPIEQGFLMESIIGIEAVGKSKTAKKVINRPGVAGAALQTKT